ncbi:MAG: DegT/DnrJ/EryC1/StrS family aminotransferase [Actinomycetota bacterium]|nr:DegT/DnrJ/EryC1/StrS family aminotransferase [Actinomycetota bacterium]
MTKATGRTIPFVDLSHVNAAVERDVLADAATIIASGEFTNGPHVERFEDAFAAFCCARACVGVASGLDGLRLALIAAGVKAGDEVIVPAQTFIATFEAVSQAGARPVVTDVSEDDYNLDPDAAAAVVSPRTRCILPVHLYGQMADMRRLGQLAARRGLSLVEDACQAHGATRDELRPGEAAAAAAFSFYPTKNLGAMGDAGALITDDFALAECARSLRQHGERVRYVSERIGYTARLDTLQAAVLLRKLPLLVEWNRQRRESADFYAAALENIGDLRCLPVPPGSRPVWHLYPLRTAHGEPLAAFLAERGIHTGRHYPQPPHLSPAYASLGYRRGEFPVAESLAAESLSLPIFPGISEHQLVWVTDSVRQYFAHGV